MRISGTIRLVAALGVVAAAGAPALAANAGSMLNSVKIDRTWVTPATPDQAPRSLARLGVAAMEACGASTFSLPDYKRAVQASPCWHDSMTDVVARIDNPYLTAAFQRRGTVEVAQNEGSTGTHAR